MKTVSTIFIFLSLFCTEASGQFPRVSVATDLGLQRNFPKNQQFFAVGHTTKALFHLDATHSVFVSFAYYSNGKYKNTLFADALSTGTQPSRTRYFNSGDMRLKSFSTGLKKYFTGSAVQKKGYSFYGFAGFGLLLGRVTNKHSKFIDTSLYFVPVQAGKANFKRLTIDTGLGVEFDIGNDFYFYTEAKFWIPTTDYPSPYILQNNKAPFPGMLGAGLRLLF